MNLRIIVFILLLSGVFIVGRYSQIPYFKDKSAKEELDRKGVDMDREEYWKKEKELRTDKVFYMDMGSGIISLSLCLLVFAFIFRIKYLEDLRNVASLKSKRNIIIISNAVWLLNIPNIFFYYFFRMSRGDYPPFADSLGIPLIYDLSSFICLLVPLNIFLLLTSYKIDFPVRIFVKNNFSVKWSVVIELFYGTFIILNCIVLYESTMDGDIFLIPIHLFFLYILLSLRAAMITKTVSQVEATGDSTKVREL
jgi:hypothetical protein